MSARGNVNVETGINSDNKGKDEPIWKSADRVDSYDRYAAVPSEYKMEQIGNFSCLVFNDYINHLDDLTSSLCYFIAIRRINKFRFITHHSSL